MHPDTPVPSLTSPSSPIPDTRRPRSRLLAAALAVLAVLTAACQVESPDAPADEARGVGDRPAELEDFQAIRPEVAGTRGAVVSGHPLASAAGYEVLQAGGNATDAVVTMAAILAVVRPHMNSVGGDAFGLFHFAGSREVEALNASGRAAAGATPAFFAGLGHETMPQSGALAVTVPGAVSGWAGALERHGTFSLARALQPAIRIAEEGFVVSATLARDLTGATELNEAGREVYTPGGVPPEAGTLLRSPALARTLRALAVDGPGALYGGEVGRALADFLEAEGSPLRLADFADHEATWSPSLSAELLGHRIHTLPPNSQGMVLLTTLGIFEVVGLEGRSTLSPAVFHDLVEARKLAFADRDRWVADPRALDPAEAETAFPDDSPPELPTGLGSMEEILEALLDPAYLAERAALVGTRAADEVEPGLTAPGDASPDRAATAPDAEDADDDGDTVYIMAVDADGNAVSWIQSIFSSFGSGLVEPTSGVVLQNRGAGFTLQEGHPNRIAPGKRPFHTLMATLVTDMEGGLVATIGTPGGQGQSQSVAQGLLHLLAEGLDPQAAVEAPRFRSEDGLLLRVEDRYPAAARAELERRGHELELHTGWTAPFGNLQIIYRTPEGLLRTGADMRREGAALAY
ncbi:MAG: gamma-glutamyltransferase family protein [Gemmatimonadota bacterium]